MRRLAEEAGVDHEEALLLLWDAGLTSIVAPEDFVPRNKLSRARRALGLHPSTLRTETDRPQVSPITEHSSPSADIAEAGSSWPLIGVPQDITLLTVDDVLLVHDALVRDFARSNDPISPPGIRSPDLLGSAVFRPSTSLGDTCKYPTVSMAGAALFHSLALNHAFHNGNKRTALVALLVFLESNQKFLDATQPQLYRLVLEVASHRLVGAGPDLADREVLALARWIEARLGEVQRGEKILKFAQLRRLLVSYGCDIQILPGNRVLITRPRVSQRWFGRKRLRSHNWYGGEGREVELNTIRKIRRELWLDEEHGVDSSRFYEARPGVDEFIAMYRKTLQRLART